MAKDLSGYATFPGVNSLVEAHISFTHGISASTATITMAPQDNFSQEVGNLVFTFGDKKITFRDCRVNQGSFQFTEAGQIWQLTVSDRRWKWAYGSVSGRYNVHREPGWQWDAQKPVPNIKPETEKTPEQLMKICLFWMNEVNYKIFLNQADQQQRPEVNWEDEVPAEALANLCEMMGYRVVLKLDNSVEIRPAGVGNQLPTDLLMTDSKSANLSCMPDALGVVCGPSLFQWDFDLQAVGQEIGGEWVPIDQLSYRPNGGWTSDPYFLMYNNGQTVQYAELARTVYRAYRIVLPQNMPMDVQGNGIQIRSFEQIVLQPQQVDRVIDGGVPVPRPAMVYGIYCGSGDALLQANNVPHMRLPVLPPLDPRAKDKPLINDPIIVSKSFAIDPQQGIVLFSDPLWLGSWVNNSFTAKPPVIRLRTSCLVRQLFTLEYIRYRRSQPTGKKNNTFPRWAKHDEIVHTYIPRRSDVNDNPVFQFLQSVLSTVGWSINGGAPIISSVDSNEAQINKECDYYCNAMRQEYQKIGRRTVKYAGLRIDLDLDGAICQVTIEVTAHGTTMTWSRNDEQIYHVIPYSERRRMEEQRGHKTRLESALQAREDFIGRNTLK